MTLEHVGHGFYLITPAQASALAAGPLPDAGQELLVATDLIQTKNGFAWLARTPHQGRWPWSIRDAGSWRLVGGTAVL